MIKGARLEHEYGPFDIIGDVHGCFDELLKLLGRLGYGISEKKGAANRLRHAVHPPDKRKLVFVGDLVDRGPKIVDVLRLVTWMVDSRVALCVPGNHDNKLLRRLRGHNVRIAHGLAQTLEELDREPPEFKSRVAAFFQNLPSHYVLDGGNLVVAHAGLKEELHGSDSERARSFALYGDTSGEADEFGLPIRYNWAADYRGKALVVYGHTAISEPAWVNNTVCIDTGCVYGGKLTALRYPEKQTVSVPAQRVHYKPPRPLMTLEERLSPRSRQRSEL